MINGIVALRTFLSSDIYLAFGGCPNFSKGWNSESGISTDFAERLVAVPLAIFISVRENKRLGLWCSACVLTTSKFRLSFVL